MNYTRRRRLAWIITSAIIILSILILGAWKLIDNRETVNRYFYDGVNNDSLSIKNDLQARAESAYNLITISEKNFDNIDKDVLSVMDSFEKISAALTVSEYYAANELLSSAVDRLYERILTSDLSESDLNLAKKQYAEFTSREKTITKDKYNERALDFNTKISKFPTNIIAIVSGTEKLELFRNGG